MNQLEKGFLSACITKYRRKRFTQKQLSEGICSKYTLSRLENGLACKDELYYALLERLGYTYKDHHDSLSIFVGMKNILTHMTAGNRNQIIQNIIQLESITIKYPNNIVMKELHFYMNIMKQHYIMKKQIAIKVEEYITLPHFQNDYYIVFMNTLCENILFYNELPCFINFMKLYKKEIDNILLDYYLMRFYQCQDYIVESDSIFKQYKVKFIEDNDHRNYFYYATLEALGYINCDMNHSIATLDKLYMIPQQVEIHPYYITGMYMGFMYISTLNNRYPVAVQLLEEAFSICEEFFDFLIPYATFLHISTNVPIPLHYFEKQSSLVSKDCLAYYTLQSTGTKQSKLADFIEKKIIRHCAPYTLRSPFTILIKEEISRIMQYGHCHKSTLRLDTLLKEVCK